VIIMMMRVKTGDYDKKINILVLTQKPSEVAKDTEICILEQFILRFLMVSFIRLLDHPRCEGAW
jgi:hypothetical protein